MSCTRRKRAIAGLWLLTFVAWAAGADYADPTGFSFTYPDGWTVVTRLARDAKDVLAPEIRNWMTQNSVDLDRVSVVLVRNAKEDFLENLNVVVDRQQIPVSDATVKKLVDMFPQKYQSMGATLTKVDGRVQRFGSREAVVLEYEARMPGVPFLLRQRQVLFPGGGNSYIVTCTAKAEAFANHTPTFDKILTSFQVPAPVAQGFDWSRTATTAIVGAVIGGVVGGLATIWKKIAGKKPESDTESPAAGERP